VAPTFSNVSGCPTILIRTLESGVNASPCGKTNFPCSSSVAIILVSGCFSKNNNKVIVVYDAATGEKNIIHEPSGSQSLEFETVEVISRDSISLSAYAKYEPLVRRLTELNYAYCLNEDQHLVDL
jgi:hypothetical protein